MERIGLAPGSEVGGYRIVAPLGSGGMGAVYRAVDGGGGEVALKLLHPHVGADAAARERLRREVAALQRLRHPGVAAVLDAEADSTEAFIVTELVDGENLARHVREHGPLAGSALAGLAGGLFEVLDAVHAAGVVHRDLKPSNVVLTAERPVLIDFGIAQGLDDAPLTSTGVVLGTPGYLAPELLDGAEPDESSDWWGWATVLAFAATGRDPFGARPLEAVVARARAGEVDLEGVDPDVAAALRAALVPDPFRRAAPADVLAALEGHGPVPETVVLAQRPDDASNDGRTVALAAFAAPGADDDTARLDAHDDDAHEGFAPAGALDDGAPWGPSAAAYDEHGDSGFDDGEVGALPASVGYVAPVPRRRTWTLLLLALAAVAVAPLAPGAVLLCIGVLTIVFGAVQSGAGALEARRERRGAPRRGDVLRAVLASPWHLVRGTVLALPSLLVAASVTVVVGGISWWLLDTRRLELTPPGNASWVYHAVLALATAAGLATLWSGPLARRTRLGARRTLERLAPGRTGAAVVIALCLVGIGVAAVLVATGEPTWWWPLPGPPSLA